MTSQVFIHTKFCKKCNQEKPITEFSKSKSKKDGYQSNCKSCMSESYKTWCNANEGRRSKTLNEWYSTNKDAIKDYRAKIIKNWQQANKSFVNASAAKRRATKLNATPIWCEHEQIKQLYQKCQSLSNAKIQYHVDHIVPLQSDIVCGLHCLANLQILSATENISKSNLVWPDMP